MNKLDLCILFGVPPELMGIQEQKTYANYYEARRAFYQETVLPLLNKICGKINQNLVAEIDSRVHFELDTSQIEAFQEKESELWNRAIDAVRAGVLTPNEARQLLGLPKVAGGNQLFMPANMVPVGAVLGEGEEAEE